MPYFSLKILKQIQITLALIILMSVGFVGKTFAYIGEDVGLNMYDQIDAGQSQFQTKMVSLSLKGSASAINAFTK